MTTSTTQHRRLRSTIVTLLACLSMLALGCDNSAEQPAGGGTAETETAIEGKKEAPTAAVDTSLPGDPVKGEEVYKKSCLACHGADGKGNGGITGANFIGDKTRLAKGNEELLTSIREGKQGKSVAMPPQKDILSDQEIKDSLAYIRKTFGNP